MIFLEMQTRRVNQLIMVPPDRAHHRATRPSATSRISAVPSTFLLLLPHIFTITFSELWIPAIVECCNRIWLRSLAAYL